MSHKPVLMITHLRSLSTAVERVFMTRPETLTCFHEPFGDAFYWGPERRSPRSESERNVREGTEFENCTYEAVLRSLLKAAEGKRVFIKDLAFHILPPSGHAASFPPSLLSSTPSLKEPNNPTVLPNHILQKFQFAFLIRNPRRSIPSQYRCTVPPLSDLTGWVEYLPSEAGYVELRRLFDYVRAQGCGIEEANGTGSAAEDGGICLIDADDLQDNPSGILRKFCHLTNLEYSDDMLSWNTKEQDELARRVFQKWKGFHEDVLASSGFKGRDHNIPQHSMTEKDEDEDWRRKYGDEGARVIRETVNANIPHYDYLKQFSLKA
ncbi:MAG: hypothetical protein Q9200_006408 [Gallowayella weberi]